MKKTSLGKYTWREKEILEEGVYLFIYVGGVWREEDLFGMLGRYWGKEEGGSWMGGV